MYVKNISQLLKEQLPLKLRLTEGDSIYGKIISQEGKNGLIKLYDGTIIPSIFLSENKLVNDRLIKFLVEGFDEDGLLLKVIDDSLDFQGEDSINTLIKKLNIPKEEGTKIINSLIRFNLPATDENIMTIYKNITFLDKLGKMGDDDILSFLHTYIEGNFTQGSKEFSIAKDIFSKLLKINTDFLSFLIENKIPYNIENILKSSDFLENKFSTNNIINTLKGLLEMNSNESGINFFSDVVKKLIEKPEILPLLNKYIEGELNTGSEEYSIAEGAFNKLSNTNTDYMTLLIERDLPKTLNPMPEVSNFINDKSFINNIIDVLKNILDTNKTELFTFSFKSIIKEFTEKPELLPLIRDFVDGKLELGSKDFNMVVEILSRTSSMNADYISSILENKTRDILSNMPNFPGSSKDTFNMDKLISTLKNLVEGDKKNISIFSLNNTVKEILDKPEVLNLLPNSVLNNFTDNVEILKHLCNNYNIYFFNSYNNDKIFKNNIIIKNKYKASNSIDPNDVKVYITVDTPNTGIVEAYLYKKWTDLTISIKTEGKHIGLFKKNIDILNKALVNKGYDVINISVEAINPETNIVSLSNFFNDTIFKELDVRV